MTYIRIDKATSPIAALGAIVRTFMPAVARKKETGANRTSHVTDKRTLEAIARLSDHHLDDIGIYRVARVETGPLARNLNSERAVTFDYFRVES